MSDNEFRLLSMVVNMLELNDEGLISDYATKSMLRML